MASSRKSKPRGAASPDLAAHVAALLKTAVKPGERIVLGLSGGVDSMVLLDTLARLRARMRFELGAVHVNHQLSPNAARWARFCVQACAQRGVPCRVAKVAVTKGASLERAAREARYEALSRSRADWLVLAHNKDDQVETVLMQLLRGAGVKGLGGMPFAKEGAGKARVLRPLLAVARAEIEVHAKRRKIAWIDDESNADTRFTRNWLRHEILPRIAERVPAYRETITRAARNLGEAAALCDELAHEDAREVRAGTLPVAVLQGLSRPRARNLLRFMIAQRGWEMPDAERLGEALRQALEARADAKLVVALGPCELRRHDGLIHLMPSQGRLEPGEVIIWEGESRVRLPHAGGVLTMARGRGTGLSAARLKAERVTVRARRGGERLQTDPRRPRRTVKNLLQEARIPPWQRERLPFIYCGDTLACIPGVAIDYRYRAQRGEASIVAVWNA
jgi:tRNA(Ile)-lysidine synthase